MMDVAKYSMVFTLITMSCSCIQTKQTNAMTLVRLVPCAGSEDRWHHLLPVQHYINYEYVNMKMSMGGAVDKRSPPKNALTKFGHNNMWFEKWRLTTSIDTYSGN